MLLEISDAEFTHIRDAIRQRLGIFYDDSKLILLKSRLQSRLAKRASTSFTEYYRFLTAHPDREAEWDELASVLSNNETFFFREPTQLDVLTTEVAHGARAQHGRLHVWSAACSSGEEPLSIAMALLESGAAANMAVRISASDVSPRVLDRAASGFYRELSLRATPPALVQKYFSPVPGGFLIAERVKQMVEFFRINLVDARAASRVDPVDAIFCRNVLMYFDKATQKRVVEAFARVLRPQGYLFLGHAESIMQLTGRYEPIVTRKAIYYRLNG